MFLVARGSSNSPSCGDAQRPLRISQGAHRTRRYFSEREGYATERVFWQQFQAPSHSELLNHQMKRLMELLRMAKPTLQDLYVNLCPVEAPPTNFFGLLARLQEAGFQMTC